jgi:hypothetical protein
MNFLERREANRVFSQYDREKRLHEKARENQQNILELEHQKLSEVRLQALEILKRFAKPKPASNGIITAETEEVVFDSMGSHVYYFLAGSRDESGRVASASSDYSTISCIDTTYEGFGQQNSIMFQITKSGATWMGEKAILPDLENMRVVLDYLTSYLSRPADDRGVYQ